MNFKTLALSSVLALGSVFGSVAGAEARPTSCWMNNGNYTDLNHFPCDVDRFYSNGSWDWEGTYFQIDGLGRVFLSGDGGAKIIFEGNNVTKYYTWEYDRQGDIRIFGTDGFEFSFRQ